MEIADGKKKRQDLSTLLDVMAAEQGDSTFRVRIQPQIYGTLDGKKQYVGWPETFWTILCGSKTEVQELRAVLVELWSAIQKVGAAGVRAHLALLQ